MKIGVLREESGRLVSLLVGSWVVWMGLDLFEVSVAYGVSRFECSILFYGFKTQWPWVRWLPGTAGIACTILILQRSGSLDKARLRGMSRVLIGLTAARLASLAPFIGVVFAPVGLLWSVHLSWALSFALGAYLWYPILAPRAERYDRLVGFGLLVGFSLVYILYGIFFVRTTILHGDEPQFLMITQSLIRDGDIDLANTLPEDSLEFHQIEDVRPHQAPASPEGKLHNTHPAGISALIVPAYWVGLRFLDHPRLAAALAISLLTALAVFLTYAFLRKARFDALVAGVVSAVAGTSPLLFLYSNQIYPDVAALVFMFPALILALDTHPVRSKAIVLGCVIPVLLLPILHPRLLPLTCLLLWMLWKRVAALPTRDFLIRAGAVATGVALVGYVAYHLHYTGDIWGPYKPGNAWEPWMPNPEVSAVGLVGQWLDLRIGLLNNAPVFGFALPGLVLLLRDRQKLGITVLLLYGATACVNANSDDWRFGYCFASRFMITALPALVLPLAVLVDRGLNRSPWILVLLSLATAVGVDTVIEAIRLPESAFLGSHLIDRPIAAIYPLGLHLPDLSGTSQFPWRDAFFWLLVGIGPVFILSLSTQRVVVLIGLILILPVLGVSSATFSSRFKDQVSARLARYDEDPSARKVRLVETRIGFHTQSGAVANEGYYVSEKPISKAGVAGYSSLPRITPSVYGLVLPAHGSGSGEDEDAASGHYVVLERTNVRAYGNHETRYSVPLKWGDHVGVQRIVRTEGKTIAYQFVTYGGTGSLRFDAAKLAINPVNLVEENEIVFSRNMNLVSEDGKNLAFGFEAANLVPGFYRFTVMLEDVDASVWFKRRTDPLMIVVFAADTEEGKKKVRRWAPMLGRAMEAVPPDGAERPMVEAYLAPYWSMVPFLGSQKMQFEFENERKQSLFIAGVYSGEYDLKLKTIGLARRTFRIWEGGELKPYRLPPKP